MIKKILNYSLSIALIFVVIGCGGKPEATSSPPANASPLDSFLVEQAPAEAQQISTLFSDPTPGREVVIAGEVMGSFEPFAAERAMVMLGDPTKITPCNRIPGDSCQTPWDVCCDDPDVIKKSVTTIQFLDSEGNVLKQGLKGYQGIEELSFLTVKGSIAEGSNKDNLLINAESLHVAEVSPFKNAKPVSGEGQ